MSKGSVWYTDEDQKNAWPVKSAALGLGFALAVVSWVGQAGIAGGVLGWRRDLLGK